MAAPSPLRCSPPGGIGLAAAAHLEVGLLALQTGSLPGAVGAFAAIDDVSWTAILRRFPNLPTLIQNWSDSR